MPRAGLTPALVVEEAAKVADEVGYDQLTLAAIAQRFGVALPSLYKHVAGLDGLQRSLASLATRELGQVVSRAAIGKARRDALRGVARAYREWAKDHPGRYAATVGAPDPDDAEHVAAAQAVLDVIFAILAGYGIEGDDLIDAGRYLHSTMHGFVTLEAGGGFGLPRDIDRSFDRIVDALDTALGGWSGAATRRRPR